MPGMVLQLLGPLSVTIDDRPFSGLHIRPSLALCIYLACRRERHRREHLIALLWPDWPPSAAHKNLRQNLYILKQALPTVAALDGCGLVPLVLADRETLQLNPDAAVDLDVDRFRSLMRQNTPEAMAAAVALYRGDFLADFYLPDSSAFEGWAAALRADLCRVMLGALDRLAAYALEQSAYNEAVTYARRQLEIDNLRESAYRQLMHALALSGQRSEALAEYERCSHLLRVDLHMEPSAATRALVERIASGEEEREPRPTDLRPSSIRHNLPAQLTRLC